MIFHIICATVFPQPHAILVQSKGNQNLTKLTGEFIEDVVPVVKVRVGGKKDSIERRFILDTGSPFSLLFVKESSAPNRQTETSADLHIATRSLGKFKLLRTPMPSNAGLRDALQRKGIDGILGVNFLRKYDLLIQYGERQVFLVDRKPDLFFTHLREAKDFECLPLFELSEDAFHLTAATANSKVFFPLLDTGASHCVLPEALALDSSKPSTTRMWSWNENIDGWLEETKMKFSSLDRPFLAIVLFTTTPKPIIAPAALGHTVVVSLRRSEIWVARR